MDIRQLEHFLQIANHGGFNRASAHLHIAQSALSRQIRQLEEELGVTLFERSGRGVQLTPAGEFMAERTETLLRQFRQTRDEVVAQSDLPKGEVVLGIPPSLQSEAGPLLNSFNQLFPDVFLTVWTGTSIELREWVLNGKVDVAVYGTLEPETVLESHPLFRDQVYLVGPAGRQAFPEVVDFHFLSDLPLVLTSRPNSMRLLIDYAAHKRNLKLDVVMDVNALSLQIDLVRLGVGYAPVPYSGMVQLIGDPRFSSAKIKGLTYNWIVGNSRERSLSAAARRLRAMLLDLADDHGIFKVASPAGKPVAASALQN